MSMLVILLPARPPLADGVLAPSIAWPYVLSAEGAAVSRQGQAETRQLPSADTVVAVVPPALLSWHRLPALPKAPTARLRAALGGLLEEQLLDDDADVHLALAPRAQAGQPTWVAAVSRAWLQAYLLRLREGGVEVDRVVPAVAPPLGAGGAAQVHFFRPEAEADGPVWVAAADAESVAVLPLAGSLARQRLPHWLDAGARLSATPAAAAVAERFASAPIAVVAEAQMALAAAGSDWNLLQFDLAASRRGTRALAQWGRALVGPAWRPARWGLAALLLVQLVGLNAWAWHQQRALAERRGAMEALLRSTHPQVRAVLDAPLQMRRETDALREAAGVPGDADLEPLLAAAASAWPDSQPPVQQIRYEPGRLSLPIAGWAAPQIELLRRRLQPGGWTVDSADGRLTIRKAAAPG